MRKVRGIILSVLMIFSFLVSPLCCFEASATTLDRYMSYLNKPFYKEYIDGVRYVYIVEDGEAAIVNIFTNFYVTGERKLVLPAKLGGYPVTMLGYSSESLPLSFYDYNSPEVFIYHSDGETLDEAFPNADYVEYDIGIWNTTLVIPEGYEYIMPRALNCFAGNIEFPKSLKAFYHKWSLGEQIYGEKTFCGMNTLVFPECKYNGDFSIDFVNDSYIFPSRNPIIDLYIDPYQWNAFETPLSICIPSNASVNGIKGMLYDSSLFPKSGYKGTTIYCADDSPTYAVIQELGGYTVNTDIPKAEYIEFPDETVNVHIGDVVDLEAKTYPTDAIWTACDYEVSDPSVVKIDEYSGRITALKEGTVTVTAKHCERGFVDTCTVNVVPEPVPGVNEIKPATDTPYYEYGNRDYTLDVTGSPSKIQVVRDNGGTTTIDRRRAKVTSNGETETWVVNMRVEAGTHNIRAKYGNKWDGRLTPFTVTYDIPPTPKAYSFDLGYKNGLGTFEVITDPQIIKVQFVLDNGCTLTYSQSYSYVAEDGLRHWVITRQIPANTRYTLKTKLGYTWTTTDLTVTS